jgi:predicted enzyme related to lactoylglutathione lyase
MARLPSLTAPRIAYLNLTGSRSYLECAVWPQALKTGRIRARRQLDRLGSSTAQSSTSSGTVESTTSQLTRIVLLVRGGPDGVQSTVQFYHDVLQLPVVRRTEEWAELAVHPLLTLHIQAESSEASLCTGYAPLLCFQVHDLDAKIAAALTWNGSPAMLDGPIQYPAHGKVAVLRTPQGHMISLYEPNH